MAHHLIDMVLGYIVTFVVALLIGGFGIYVGALFVTGEDDYSGSKAKAHSFRSGMKPTTVNQTMLLN